MDESGRSGAAERTEEPTGFRLRPAGCRTLRAVCDGCGFSAPRCPCHRRWFLLAIFPCFCGCAEAQAYLVRRNVSVFRAPAPFYPDEGGEARHNLAPVVRPGEKDARSAFLCVEDPPFAGGPVHPQQVFASSAFASNESPYGQIVSRPTEDKWRPQNQMPFGLSTLRKTKNEASRRVGPQSKSRPRQAQDRLLRVKQTTPGAAPFAPFAMGAGFRPSPK